MVRFCIRRSPEPSVWIVQMRSTSCHSPSWQKRTIAGSVGDDWIWFKLSWLGKKVFTSPVWILTVKNSSMRLPRPRQPHAGILHGQYPDRRGEDLLSQPRQLEPYPVVADRPGDGPLLP